MKRFLIVLWASISMGLCYAGSLRRALEVRGNRRRGVAHRAMPRLIRMGDRQAAQRRYHAAGRERFAIRLAVHRFTAREIDAMGEPMDVSNE